MLTGLNALAATKCADKYAFLAIYDRRYGAGELVTIAVLKSISGTA